MSMHVDINIKDYLKHSCNYQTIGIVLNFVYASYKKRVWKEEELKYFQKNEHLSMKEKYHE